MSAKAAEDKAQTDKAALAKALAKAAIAKSAGASSSTPKPASKPKSSLADRAPRSISERAGAGRRMSALEAARAAAAAEAARKQASAEARLHRQRRPWWRMVPRGCLRERWVPT